jgi:hypothetical protein
LVEALPIKLNKVATGVVGLLPGCTKIPAKGVDITADTSIMVIMNTFSACTTADHSVVEAHLAKVVHAVHLARDDASLVAVI